MATLVLGKPSNLHLPHGATVREVDSDVHNICERIKEISPTLSIHVLEGQGKYIFAVFEDCADGVYRQVKKYTELDDRVVQDMRYFMAKPLAARAREIELAIEKEERDRDEERFERLYEEMGRPMWSELEKCGFIQRPASYPKLGVATGGKRAR